MCIQIKLKRRHKAHKAYTNGHKIKLKQNRKQYFIYLNVIFNREETQG